MSAKTVLLVDDDADFILQQKVRLEAAGYSILTAGSMDDAEQVLQETRPDCVVLDLMMENDDAGFTLAYRIKRKDETIPVILCSGVARETGLSFDASTDEERSWVRADAFLSKPVRIEQLTAEIERLTAE